MMKLLFTILLGLTLGARAEDGAIQSASTNRLRYRTELDAFRKEFGVRQMPDVPFFQFGMGPRTKLLFKEGALRSAITGEVLKPWDARQTIIVPPDYSVALVTADGKSVRIFEDDTAVWIEENGVRSEVKGTRAPVRLPAFSDHRYSSMLRVLHHELLMNVIGGLPVPNFYVYKKPWYRDGAMMALCFQKTGNLDVIRDWVLKLNEPFDRNNGGEIEADNPGQALFLISLVSDKNHPLVPKLLEALKKFETTNEHGVFIKGRSDFAFHPVYQTKWAQFGLRALGLPDPYVIPAVPDSYSSLFWMDFREAHVKGTEATDRGNYAYLGWATDHFLGEKKSPISNRDYPLTWEIRASQADYRGMEMISPLLAREKISGPHTWHAAEVFLHVLDLK